MNPALKRIHKAALRLFAERGVTQVNVSDLAEAASVARGTIYNNLASTDLLFEEVASQLETEMLARTAMSFESIEDPAERLANGIRLFIRRAHEELRTKGVEFLNAPHLIHRHADGTEEWMAFFKDLEGRPLAIMSLAKPPSGMQAAP